VLAAVVRLRRCRRFTPSARLAQGPALPSGTTEGRGDRCRHASCRRRPARSAAARPHRDPVARRTTHPRGARADRGRSRSPARRAARPTRQRRRRRAVGMDTWGWEELHPWLELRIKLPVGPLFCVINGTTRGRRWSGAGARAHLAHAASAAGVRRRFAPHQLRHAHAVEMAREGVPLTSFNVNSATATSASPRSVCKASTTPRSSTPSIRAARLWSRSAQRYDTERQQSRPALLDQRFSRKAIATRRRAWQSLSGVSSSATGDGGTPRPSVELQR
jgi:hypothetical protein